MPNPAQRANESDEAYRSRVDNHRLTKVEEMVYALGRPQPCDQEEEAREVAHLAATLSGGCLAIGKLPEPRMMVSAARQILNEARKQVKGCG